MSDVQYFEYSFDSRDATNSYSTDYTNLNWPDFIFENPLQNVVGLKVIEFEAPYTFYAINSANNTFVINDITAGSGNQTVTLPVGQYDEATILTALVIALNAAVGLNWVVTYNVTTLKLFFSNIEHHVFTLTFGVEGDVGTTNPRKVLGFNAGTTTPTFELFAPNVFMPSPTSYLYINSLYIGTYLSLHLPKNEFNSKGGNGTELCKAQVNVSNGKILWQDPDPEKFFSCDGIGALQHVDLFVSRDGDENPIDFNGASFSIKLGVLQRTGSAVSNYTGVRTVRRA